jgi:hypothetical protein
LAPIHDDADPKILDELKTLTTLGALEINAELLGKRCYARNIREGVVDVIL